MAIHNDLPSMSREAIEEYLAIANYCITARKADGGVYGYPAVLLLFSVVDALSNYAGHPPNSFLAMKDVLPSLSEKQIKSLADWYRHLPAHQAIIMPGTKLTVDDPGDAIELNAADEPTHIRVKPLFEAVKTAWDKFNPAEIKPRYRQEKAPKQPIVNDQFSALFGPEGESVPEVDPEDLKAVAREYEEMRKRHPGKQFAIGMELLKDVCKPGVDVSAVSYRYMYVSLLPLIAAQKSPETEMSAFQEKLSAVLKDGELIDAALKVAAKIPMTWAKKGLPFDFDEFLRLCA
jgi:hypothetical protein